MVAVDCDGAARVFDVRNFSCVQTVRLDRVVPGGASCATYVRRLDRAVVAAVGPAARKAPTWVLPDWAVKLAGIFDPAARLAVPDLGKQMRVE